MDKRPGYLSLALLVVGHVAMGSLWGMLFPAQPWVETLAKPALYPPGWAFGVAWTILYALMGVSVWVLLRARPLGQLRPQLLLYGAQLVLNWSFSPLFFGLQSPLAGVLVTTLLWPLVAATILAFSRVSPTAAVLLAPYLAWVSFALYLAIGIWRLFPSA